MNTDVHGRRSTLSVKLSREEREALCKLAAKERLPFSQLVRRLIWQAARKVGPE